MSFDKPLTVEGDPVSPYQLFRTGLNGELLDKLAEAYTQEELWAMHKRRYDYRYAILHSRKQIWPTKQ